MVRDHLKLGPTQKTALAAVVDVEDNMVMVTDRVLVVNMDMALMDVVASGLIVTGADEVDGDPGPDAGAPLAVSPGTL
jgi:hypothetical protein